MTKEFVKNHRPTDARDVIFEGASAVARSRPSVTNERPICMSDEFAKTFDLIRQSAHRKVVVPPATGANRGAGHHRTSGFLSRPSPHWSITMRTLVILVMAAVTFAGCGGGPDLIARGPQPSAARFDVAALIVASDLDMAASGYADSQLRQISGERDRLTILSDLQNDMPAASTVFASNSVVGWPGALAISPDRRYVYVVETQAEIADEIKKVDSPFNASPGKLLSVVDVSDMAKPRAVTTFETCGDPTSVDVGPGGEWLAIGCRDAQNPLVVVSLAQGLPVAVRALPLSIPPDTLNAKRPGFSYARLSPDGKTMAVAIGGGPTIGFVRLQSGADGTPVAAEFDGAPVSVKDAWFTMGRWSSDGRHYLTADTGWGPNGQNATANGPGQIVSFAYVAGGTHQVVSKATVSLSPEGFDVNASGTLLAVANMERTYLPDWLPYSLFGRRDRSSLSLVSFDLATGELRTVDGPLACASILPEDVVFDDDGDMIAVLSYHEKSDKPQGGWVEFFEVTRTESTPRLQPTGRRLALPRGAHDLLVLRAK